MLVFETGEEVMSGLAAFAERNNITAASFTAIGAFSSAIVGYYEADRKDYKRIPINEQAEVLSIVGNIAMYNDKPRLHAHAVVARSDGTALGGHLFEGYVRPTLEVVLVESRVYLRREMNEATGLPLLVDS